MGFTTTIIPFSPSLPFFFVLCGINGFVMGSLDTGGNVLCLDIWQGFDDSGPFMHSIHFAWGFGAFMAPLVAENFLMSKSLLENSTDIKTNTTTNQLSLQNGSTVENSGYGIDILYPILGVFTVLVSTGYLAVALKDRQCGKTVEVNSYKKIPSNEKEKSNNSMIIIFILAFLFLYAGMEVLYGTYLATFSVQSKLQLSRKIGARVTAIFWGSFTTMRFLAIFVAVKLSPSGTLIFSFILSVVGSTLLAIFGQTSVETLSIFTAFMGVGMAPIYASSMLWMDQFMKVTNKIGGLMTVAAGVGMDSFPLFLGQFIADFPMLLMYMQVGIIYLCILLFTTASCIGQRRGGRLGN